MIYEAEFLLLNCLFVILKTVRTLFLVKESWLIPEEERLSGKAPSWLSAPSVTQFRKKRSGYGSGR